MNRCPLCYLMRTCRRWWDRAYNELLNLVVGRVDWPEPPARQPWEVHRWHD